MLASVLINKARERLGDKSKQRWTDSRMLDIVNQGQASICKLTGIYRKEAYIALANFEGRYKLPTDCMTIRRIEYNGEVVPLFTRDDIDSNKYFKSDFVCLKDNIGMGMIEIYPALEDLETDIVTIKGYSSDFIFYLSSNYGVTIDVQSPFYVADVYGVVESISSDGNAEYTTTKHGELASSPVHPDIDASFNSAYGVVVDMEVDVSTDKALFGFITDSEVYTVVGKYGVTTSIVGESNLLKIFYEAVPMDVSTLTSTLSIPDMWEEAMLQYIVGTALQDDNDANNIQRGELELSKFTSNLMKARELSSKDFSGGTRDKLHTTYRRI